MRIGKLASECGCSVETIRYYEKIGLLSKPERAENGYRIYTDNQFKWLQFILRCREIGLSQHEIRQLVNLERDAPAKCDDVSALLTDHLVLLRKKLASLNRMEKAISRLQEKCKSGTLNECPVIIELLK
jgi:MerR family mercuric resistance operon transcriptional regulator